MLRLPPIKLETPSTVQEAARALANAGGNVRFVARLPSAPSATLRNQPQSNNSGEPRWHSIGVSDGYGRAALDLQLTSHCSRCPRGA